MNSVKTISIFGSTGILGQKSLDIISKHRSKFELIAISGHSNHLLLIEQAIKFNPRYVLVTNKESFHIVKSTLEGQCTVLSPEDYIDVCSVDTDITFMAISGIAALPLSFSVLGHTKILAMANKETIVAARFLFTNEALKRGASIIPVDSEHCGVFQCLLGENKKYVKKITLTASGGPFRKLSAQELSHVTVNEALNHPTWNMGKKITIDSASMMNKALEIIEAAVLFNIDIMKIDAVIHPQSIVHSFVSFKNGSQKASLGVADMSIPISYSLFFPEQNDYLSGLDFSRVCPLEFYPLKDWQLENVNMAYDAFSENKTIAFNAANEIAVREFLNGKILFSDIARIILKIVSISEPERISDVSDILNYHYLTQELTQKACN